jgi:hypothetical protein
VTWWLRCWWTKSENPVSLCVIHHRQNPIVSTSTVALWDVGGDKKGSLESETVKYGRQSHGTRTWKWMRWQWPAAIVNDRPILSPERVLYKNYDCRCSTEKEKFSPWVSRGSAPRQTDWRYTASCKVTLTLTFSQLSWVGWLVGWWVTELASQSKNCWGSVIVSCCCEKLVVGTRDSSGTQRKGNIHHWKPLPSNS